MLKDIKEILRAFEKEILRANSCNQCYFDMKYHNERNGEWDLVYKIAPAFFALARKALQTEAFVTISKLYEEQRRSDYNLQKLLLFLEANSKQIDANKYHEINAEVSRLKIELTEKQQIANKILHIRDKIIAHNDKEYFTMPENKASNISISFEQVKDLLDFAAVLVNTFNYILFQERSVMTYTNGWLGLGHDLDQLMTFCLKHLQQNTTSK